jgi:hypothetical protein
LPLEVLMPNPVLACHDRSLKDASLVHDGKAWVMTCSAFSEERSTIAVYRSPDLSTWSGPTHTWDGQEDGWIGLCSPDITCQGDGWVMTYNSWGDTRTERRNRFFYRQSKDLRTFSEPKALAHDLLDGIPVIDSALARHDGRWFLACSRTETRGTWIASAESLDGPWAWVGDGPIHCAAAITGLENGYHHENYQFLAIDEVWHLITTDYPPHQAWIYRLDGDPADMSSWQNWPDGRPLTIRSEKWNTIDTINAVALWDHQSVDGRFYAVFGGKGRERSDEFNVSAGRKPWPRGWNRIGIAWSEDLARWTLPG